MHSYIILIPFLGFLGARQLVSRPLNVLFLCCCSGDASGPLFRPQFVPPSVEQRQGIAETLADALPGVEHGQAQLRRVRELAVFCLGEMEKFWVWGHP